MKYVYFSEPQKQTSNSILLEMLKFSDCPTQGISIDCGLFSFAFIFQILNDKHLTGA